MWVKLCILSYLITWTVLTIYTVYYKQALFLSPFDIQFNYTGVQRDIFVKPKSKSESPVPTVPKSWPKSPDQDWKSPKPNSLDWGWHNNPKLSQVQFPNSDHCIWRARINHLCKSGLDHIDCKSSSRIKIQMECDWLGSSQINVTFICQPLPLWGNCSQIQEFVKLNNSLFLNPAPPAVEAQLGNDKCF